MVVDFFSQLGNLVHLFRFYFLLFHHTKEVFSQGWWSKAHVSHEERCILLSGTHSPEKVFIKSDLILRVTESFLILAMKCIHCRLCWLLLSYLHSGTLPNGSLLSYVAFEAPGATVSLCRVRALPAPVEFLLWDTVFFHCDNHRLCRDELLCFFYDKASHDVRDQAAIWM